MISRSRQVHHQRAATSASTWARSRTSYRALIARAAQSRAPAAPFPPARLSLTSAMATSAPSSANRNAVAAPDTRGSAGHDRDLACQSHLSPSLQGQSCPYTIPISLAAIGNVLHWGTLLLHPLQALPCRPMAAANRRSAVRWSLGVAKPQSVVCTTAWVAPAACQSCRSCRHTAGSPVP